MLLPRLLIRQHIRDNLPHLVRNLRSLPAHTATLLPLLLDLVPLTRRNLPTTSVNISHTQSSR